MKPEETVPKLVRDQRRHRSQVTNGKKLFATVPGLDGRTQTARRFRDLYEIICNDLGGASGLKEGQRKLARRAASLSVMSEAIEADIVRDLPFDSDVYGMLCDRLGRCLSRLGLAPTLLERGDRSDPRDIRVFRIIGGLPTPPPPKPKPQSPIGSGLSAP